MKYLIKLNKEINLMKYSVILMLLLLSMPLIFADLTPAKTSITIKIYNNTIEFISEYGELNNWTGTFNIVEYFNNSEITSNGSVKGYSKTFDFIFIKEDTIENIDFFSEWKDCEVEKGKVDTGYSTCAVTRDECLSTYEGENATTNKEELDACNLRNQQKDIEIQGQQTTIGNLEEEEESTKNLKWIYAVVAAILGIVGCLVYCGKIGKGMVKDKSEDEFNKRQSG